MARRKSSAGVNIECFSCSGGMAEGFRRARITFDYVFDKDPNAVASYTKNLGHAPIQMDVRDLVRMVRAGWSPGPVRLFVADPPCTPWSRAGKREGIADERDMLRETADLITLLRPRFYLIGNVPGLQDSTSWHVVQDVIGGLQKHGYCVADYVQLDAADYGVPQHRVRPFWFGHLGGDCIRWPAPTHGAPRGDALPGLGLPPWVTCRAALQHLPIEEMGRPVQMKIRPSREGGGKNGGDRSRCSRPDEAARTVVAGEARKGGQILIPTAKHPAAALDGLAPTIRGGGEGHSAPQVVLEMPPSRHDKPVHTSDADEPARALTTQCRAPGHATTVVFNRRHPPASPAPTVGAKDRGQGTVLMTGPADGRGTDKRHPSSPADAPSMSIKTNTGRDGSGAALAWPWERPSTTVYAEDRIMPPGHHDGSNLSQPNAIVLSERAAAILQGFPDGWLFAGETKKARWSQIGQAMPPPLAHAVAGAVAEAMAVAEKSDAP